MLHPWEKAKEKKNSFAPFFFLIFNNNKNPHEQIVFEQKQTNNIVESILPQRIGQFKFQFSLFSNESGARQFHRYSQIGHTGPVPTFIL